MATRRATEIESREQLTFQEITITHDKTCEYIVAQHREVVDELRRDNKLLREENATLARNHETALATIQQLR